MPLLKMDSLKTPPGKGRGRTIPRNPFNPKTLVDGVFEGGGTLGTAFAGSLAALQANNFWFKRVVGNSAGAITAAMIAAGYTAADIEWLMQGYPNGSPRPSTIPPGVNQVNFLSFIDMALLPDQIDQATREQSLLWRAYKGEFIDVLLNLRLPIPTGTDLLADALKGIKALPLVGGPLAGQIEDVLRPVLSVLKSDMRLKDVIPDEFSTEAERRKFADFAWSFACRLNPAYALAVNFLYAGGICKGDVFKTTIENLLEAKLKKPRPTFADLPMPLAVIATDTEGLKPGPDKDGQMKIYSRYGTPDMEVAEAVRRSMSIPFVFQPRRAGGHEIMDGGLVSNFPFWLLTAAGEGRVSPDDGSTRDADAKRWKLGFFLDESEDAKPEWDTPKPAFTDRQGRPTGCVAKFEAGRERP